MKKYHDLTLLSLCGSGRYGDVWLCRDLSDKIMAVKIISKKRIGDDWERELKGIRNYREITEGNPHLLKIGFVGEDEESFFYTMEAADSCSEGEYQADTLAERLNVGPLPSEQIYPVLSGIFEGIKAIHQAGFAHRDIKPDNILFVNGIPKIADMGLLSSVNSSMTQIAGTPDFMPPELFGSSSTDSLSRQSSDLYAFGKVIYCVVSGQEPQNFPTLPHDLKLTLAGKLFMRLSMRLSHREPEWRIQSLYEIEYEMKEIERKLTYGETFRDHLSYVLETSLRNNWIALVKSVRWSLRHWLILLIAVLVLLPVAYKFRPRKPFDIAEVKTKRHINPILKYSMTIPFDWDVLTEESIRKKLQAKLDKGELTSAAMQKKVAMVKTMLSRGMVTIYCDYVKKFPDNCFIQSVRTRYADYQNTSDDVLNYQFKELFRSQLGPQCEVYEVKRCRIADTPCIHVYLAPQPGQQKTLFYLFLFEHHGISFTLNVKEENALKRKEQIDAVFKTLKFEK